jgi:hypothetical protein
MGNSPVTLDFSKAQPISGGTPGPANTPPDQPVKLDFSKAQVLPGKEATQPGAYQQSPGGPIENANADAAHPFSDSTTSVLGDVLGTKPTGAMMKRDTESDSQFMARVKEAAKTVTPEQIEQESRGNAARTLPTLAAAATAGPAMLAGEAGLAEGVPAAAKVGVEAAKATTKWIAANPIKAYLLIQSAHELGIGPEKLLKLFHLVGE